MTPRFVLLTVIVAFFAASAIAEKGASPVSKTITEVLREPLPAEDLHCSESAANIVVEGPTFRYTIEKKSGAIADLETVRDGRVVAKLRTPAKVWIDDFHLEDSEGGVTNVVSQDVDQVIVETKGVIDKDTAYALQSTIYNDGVVVTEVTIRPQKPFSIRRGIRYEIEATGRFSQYLHKRRDTNGMDCLKGPLPKAEQFVDLLDLTSCLEVYSTEAALAMFTDRGGAHRWPVDVGTASLRVGDANDNDTAVVLTQHVVRVASGGPPYVLPPGEAFTFRVGLAVAPNRLPHPRWRDLRMFTFVGDDRNPYPTDEEILTAARLGFTLFQMHRVGTPGEPRPPAGELERVIDTVHQAGMLFVWTANADLMYANAGGVAELRSAGNWSRWQGFNYGGNYTAPMDSYCSLVATCLASPNGLADYRVASVERMLEQYAVDGMYIDDNLAYANCTLQKEHGHPEAIYDSLIELHDMNWRRRKALKAKYPHAVLVDHCSRGLVLPVISAFDVHLFGEGYSFPSVEAYWDSFGTLQNLPAQGALWPGDSESNRCSAEIAYIFDLLTGGGQYSYLDWRLWPEKFPYAAGVHPDERLFVKTYNLAQFYFGMYESNPYSLARSREQFVTTTPQTYATAYRNETWNDALVVVANMDTAAGVTSVQFRDSKDSILVGQKRVAVYDVNYRTTRIVDGGAIQDALDDLELGPQQMKLFYVRPIPTDAVYHQWGGKRISENWDVESKILSLDIHGPIGLEDTIFFGMGDNGIKQVNVNGSAAEFFVDPNRNVIHGNVTFSEQPIRLEVICTRDGSTRLPIQSIVPDELAVNVLIPHNSERARRSK